MDNVPRPPFRDKSNDVVPRADAKGSANRAIAVGFLDQRETHVTAATPPKVAASKVSTAAASPSTISTGTTVNGDSAGRPPAPRLAVQPSHADCEAGQFSSSLSKRSADTVRTSPPYFFHRVVPDSGADTSRRRDSAVVAASAAASVVAPKSSSHHADLPSRDFSRHPSTPSSLSSCEVPEGRQNQHHNNASGHSRHQQRRQGRDRYQQIRHHHLSDLNISNSRTKEKNETVLRRDVASDAATNSIGGVIRPPNAPPPPVACTLVAFGPGSLGLELEAVTGGSGYVQDPSGAQGRPLGCRVFRVTPDGQAARHGSVHPGDALVVLDGVDVLSEPFEAITKALLDRRGRRRLLGFMGATTAAAFSRTMLQTKNRGLQGDRERKGSDGSCTDCIRGRGNGIDKYVANVVAPSATICDSGRSATSSSNRRGRDGEKGNRRLIGHYHRQAEQGFDSYSSAFSPDTTGALSKQQSRCTADNSPSLPSPSSNARGQLSTAKGSSIHDSSRSRRDGRGSGRASPTMPSSRCYAAPEGGWEGRSAAVSITSRPAHNNNGGEGGRNYLGNSWGSLAPSATTGRSRGSRIRPLDGSRGESLQRSLEEAMQEKTALAAERAWLLEELQRAKEATLEREGAIAGQEVQTDVLRMEINSLEGELRRAQQELGACEAGRRELSEAVKRDLARRDRDAADSSSQLRRERAAREREAENAAAALARASSADGAAARAATAARAAIEEAQRRAEEAEGRATEAEKRRDSIDAAAREAAVNSTATLRRERERREIEVREREQEMSSMMLSLESAEGRARRVADDKGAQMREFEQAAVRSLELSERRRAESDKKAAAVSGHLKEREAEWRKLETQLRQACAASKREAEEGNGLEIRRLKAQLREAEKTSREREGHTKAENERLAKRVGKEERKLSDALARLRKAEHSARMLETGASAARQRAEASARKEAELSTKLSEIEINCARQEVTLTTLKAQLEEVRRGAAAGDAALRERPKLRKTLEKVMAILPPPSAAVKGVCTDVSAESARGSIDVAIDGDIGAVSRDKLGPASSLHELSEALLRRLEWIFKDVDSLRGQLAMISAEKEALRERGQDAAELRSLLEEKRGLSAELAKGAERARVKAERAEAEAERARGEASSLRAALELAERQLEERKAKMDKLNPRVLELEQSLSKISSEAEASAVRAQEAETAMSTLQHYLKQATARQLPLEDAMAAAEAERMDALRRLTLKDGDLLTVQSRLEAALAELSAVKLAMFQGSSDQQAFHKRRACVAMAVVLNRHESRSAAAAVAFLRWRQQHYHVPGHAAESIPSTPSPPIPMDDDLEGKAEDVPQGSERALQRAINSAAAAGAEAALLKRENAELLGVSRSTRSELATVHLRTRMCGARVLVSVLQKWASRQSARAFWRLRATSMSASVVNSGTTPGIDVSSLTIVAPQATCEYRHRPRSSRNVRSPPLSDDGGGWYDRRSPSRVRPKSSSDENGDRGSTTSTRIARASHEHGRSGSRAESRASRKRLMRHSPPPRSPASTGACGDDNDAGSMDRKPQQDTGRAFPDEKSTASKSQLVGFAFGRENAGANTEIHSRDDVGDVSMASAASSEPRCHCLGTGDSGGDSPMGSLVGSPIRRSPRSAWGDTLSVSRDEGGKEADLLDLSESSVDRDGEESDENAKDKPKIGDGREVKKKGERGGRTMKKGCGVSPSGGGVGGFGLQVDVAESEGSWWALSDESV